jgi:hypothetical protein
MKSTISTEKIREELYKLLENTIIEMDNKLSVDELDIQSIHRLTSQRVIIKRILLLINTLEQEEE